MSRHWKIAIALGLVICITAGYLGMRRSSAEKRTAGGDARMPSSARSTSTSGQSGTEVIPAATRQERAVLAAFDAPIEFYGKVVDEGGQPVEGAQIKFGIADSPAGSSSYHIATSDATGLFRLIGRRGAGVSVWVSKVGYYTTAEARARSFVYGGVRTTGDEQNPSSTQPAVFVLRKMGVTEPLLHRERDTFRIPKDGTPIEIDITNGRIVKAGGHLRLEVWTANQAIDPNRPQPYNWEARLSVVDGGLVERSNEYAFTAPASGYAPSFETGMSKDSKPWSDGFQKEFFIKLADGRFARVAARLRTGGDHFFVLETWFNPTSGHRNLEFDRNKKITTAN